MDQKRVSVWMSLPLAERVAKAADKAEMSDAAWIRQAVLEKLSRADS